MVSRIGPPQVGLWKIVRRELTRARANLTPKCESLVRTLVAKGEAAVAREPQRRGEAEANLRFLIAGMLAVAQTKGENELHEWSYRAALKKLCPLFPFC